MIIFWFQNMATVKLISWDSMGQLVYHSAIGFIWSYEKKNQQFNSIQFKGYPYVKASL